MGAVEVAWRYIEVDPNTGCWIWVGALGDGAPYLKVAGRAVRVSRLLYESEHGPLGRRRALSTCGVQTCVRPAHRRVPMPLGARHNRVKRSGMVLCAVGHRPLPTWADVETIRKTKCHHCRRALQALRRRMLRLIHGGAR